MAIRRHGARVVGALACGVVGIWPAAAAAADATPGPDDGLWYLTSTGVAAAQARTQGAGITVGLIDGVIDPDAPDLRGSRLTVHEPSFCRTGAGDATAWAPAVASGSAAQHATGMAALLVGTGGDGTGVRGVAPAAQVVSYAVLTERAPQGSSVSAVCPRSPGDARGWLEGAIDAAIADHVDILSVSLTGSASEPAAIARALHAGIVVVAAQAHGGPTPAYPASSNGVLAVESSGPDGSLAAQASIDPANTVVAPGQDVRQPSADLTGHTTESGSSTATAFTAGVLALAWSAHPGATGNQVLQALVRSADHPGDGWGLGAVDVPALLALDPTTLPDTNPLVRAGALPSAAQIAAAPTTAGPSATLPSATLSAAPPDRPLAGRTHRARDAVLGAGIAAALALALAGGRAARRARSTSRSGRSGTGA